MKNSILVLLVTMLLSACHHKTTSTGSSKSMSDNGSLTKAEKAEGWESLFDGKSTKGWHVFQNKTDGSAWKVADGVLYLDSTLKKNGKIVGGGDLVTDLEYENFDFELEWKISTNGNSGIIFLTQEDTIYQGSYHTGPEMQVLDNIGHPDSKIHKHRAGDLYDLIACSKETVKPANEWNKAEIILNKGKLDLYLNGENVVSTTIWDENWNNMVAGSKFKQYKDFATFKKGHIALQDHESLVWFRNIRIRKL
jgi:Domain of Unknown Function (DUF1080)